MGVGGSVVSRTETLHHFGIHVLDDLCNPASASTRRSLGSQALRIFRLHQVAGHVMLDDLGNAPTLLATTGFLPPSPHDGVPDGSIRDGMTDLAPWRD